ncbi:MAG: NAD-dependent DNA ligase [Deltaproteobacteria bacterium HGW-Deltaproteobacteria-15]|jgi:hypothetical protein|nr:MAG: NAD-dependent DNA ligase [Deltaproteobacteria bacterium HGW-Deltaproteobacteria-15]
MDEEHERYRKFCSRANLDKTINSLLGIIHGITADSRILDSELVFLQEWLAEQAEFVSYHPYTELLPVVEAALSDHVLSGDEQADILWLCNKILSSNYYDRVTASMQHLQGLMGGIISDGNVNEEELAGLDAWLIKHDELRTCWPYDEVAALITGVMKDKKIDENEQRELKAFFGQFTAIADSRVVIDPPGLGSVRGICAVCPEVLFPKRMFCFTGSSYKYTRKQFTELVVKLGGKVTNTVSQKLSYLIIGADGNPCWAYACYGRKVEAAVELRKRGYPVMLVHENDFHDAVADFSGV